MKFTLTDIIFMVFIGPIPPGMLKTPDIPEELPTPLEVPITEDNPTIGVLFGKRHIKKVHLLWYGDVGIRKVLVNAYSKK